MKALTLEDFQALADAAPVGHVSLTPAGEIGWMNRSARDLLGQDAADSNRIAFSRRIDPEDRAAFGQCINTVLETGDPQTLDLRLVRGDGGRLPVRLHLVAARNREGAKHLLWATLMDITDLRRAEAALERSVLSTEAARRTQSEFLANMSHEFRTPLSAIIGFADILNEDKGLDDEGKNHLAVIRACGDHLLTLIEETLSLSRIDTRQSALTSVPFNLSSVIHHVFHVMRIKANEKALTFHHETKAPLPDIVRGDKQKLTQVLMHLTANAVKFTETGKVTIQTGYCKRHAVFRISVADTGVGISSDDMDRIFEPFFRSGDREGYIEGPGLGLTVSKKYVEAMDGSLTVRSVRGQGSVFTAEVRLPADDIETVPDSEPFHRVCGEIDRCRLPEKRKHQMESEWTDGDADGSPSTRKERRGWVTLPPTEILDRMRGFARRGALNDLESALKAAAASDPALGPFCDAAAGFVDRCDEEGLLMYIERLENKENGR